MKLTELQLENFQGIRSLSVKPNGLNISLYGTNASGKTTVFNALTWLLFDKASTGEKGYSPKTKDADGNDVHNVNNSVHGTFTLDDGLILTLRKELHEKWTKKRGSDTEEYSGNETLYYIDGVPVQKSAYEKRIADICDPQKAMMLTQTAYFPEMLPWQDRRQILLDICGDITDMDVLHSSAELQALENFLQKPGTIGQFYTVDEYRQIATAGRKKLNEELKTLPVRIDEAMKAIPETSAESADSINSQLGYLRKRAAEISSSLTTAGTSDIETKARQHIAEIQAERAEAKSRYIEAHAAEKAAYTRRIASLQAHVDEERNNKSMADKHYAEVHKKIEAMKALRVEMVDLFKKTEGTEWRGDTICPTCGQPLPESEIEAARAKFNENRANQLEKIRKRMEAECSKVMIAELEAKLHEAEDESNRLMDACLNAENELSEARVNAPHIAPFETTEEYAQLCDKEREHAEMLNDTANSIDDYKKKLRAELDGVNQQINTLQTQLISIETAEKQRQRVEQLKADEKRLHKEYEQYDRAVYLCELFIRTKVQMLNSRINEKFDSVKFRLFKEQINGGIKEDCEVMIPAGSGLVPYSSANNAAKINAGLEIIDTLATYWGITLPVFVDNAESVVQLRPITSQAIRLVVSEADDTLRMEVDA